MQANIDESLATPSLTAQVHRRLRDDLLRGVLAPGAKLKVQALAESYGAGASPVREALSSLAAEGLVERLDSRGFRAAPASVADFDELVRARCWLEEVVLRESLLAGDPAWEEALVVAHWRLKRLIRADPAWEGAHAAFHQALLAACPSPTLRGMAETLRERAERYRAVAKSVAYPGRDVAAEHAAIAEAALAREVPRAVALLQEHYRSTAAFLREALAKR
ncbi:GntR family transcriptional regulator [Falsiroseomonas selenitidurans]|uniref:FCD domain-containing protein n=1 Tax=Falsiroseomonas selenitidurans TaxID=2716335 RepID=A0ABX1E889_9PROT|nr:GntR family transcriptional regulator [Falsiroseomonas selenitidurans]NKC33407.1 FCD domain-containing protein [Falsiroseomonas selenitidurans]